MAAKFDWCAAVLFDQSELAKNPGETFISKLQSRTRHVLRGDLHLDVGGADFFEAV